ncbi:MAG TPA: FAD-dependent oxidoreductase [Caulobacteraceae bacterium]|nr:FAD-dependent oxidoreductase [Caulobacteraceae bacterium]
MAAEPDRMSGCDFDLAVIGSGVGGLTAALFSAQLGLRTVVFADPMPGGQVLNVEELVNFPGLAAPTSGADLCAIVEGQATAAGAELRYDRATAIGQAEGCFTVTSHQGAATVQAVIVATGSSSRRLGIPGEDDFEGRGVSRCAACDGAFFKNQSVAVIGGGDSAAEGALLVAKFASEVLLVVREADLHAAASTQAQVRAEPKIKLSTATEPVEITGGEAGVSALRLRHLSSDQHSDLTVSGVFIYAGLEPNTQLLAPLLTLEPTGHVATAPDMQTQTPGLYAIGDIRAGFAGYLINAASDGAVAAASAARWISGRRSLLTA